MSINDPILKAYVKEFSEREGLDALDGGSSDNEAYVFERFANYTVLARLYGTDVPLPDFSMGEARGIDGLAVLVNNQFVDNKDTLDDISATSIEAEFVFTQVKRSVSLDEGDIHKFCSAIRDFVRHSAKDRPRPENEDMTRMRAVRDRLFERSRDFTDTPKAKLYYIYSGKHRDNKSVDQIFSELRQDLVEDSFLLSKLSWNIIDIDKLREWYRTVTRGTSKDIQFKERVELPPVNGVKLAVLGFLRAKDYLALITDEDGNLEQGIFEENVRAYLGDTKTNLEIANTLRNEGGLRQEWFPLLHNGVTIVARDVRQLGSKLSLRDLQVVNGCQSSHVLHSLRAQMRDDLSIPTKVIVTENTDVTDSVIRGTNRQNEITDEAFVAMDAFQKGLESYYGAYAKQCAVQPGLVYERRAHQYDDPSRSSLAGLYPVSIPFQIKSFIGMFSGEPQLAHRYYGQLLEQFGPRSRRPTLFAVTHRDKYAPYYVSSLFCLRLERLWARRVLESECRSFKFLLLDALRTQLVGKSIQQLMAQPPKVIDAECANVIEFWKDMSVATDRIREIVSDIEKLHKQFQFNSRQNAAQSETFSRAVRALYSSPASEVAAGGLPEPPMNQTVVTSPIEYDRGDESRRITGNVVKSQPGFGFIEAPNRTKVFLHVSEFSDGTPEMPPVGTLVNYELASTVKGPRAKSVRIVVT